MQTAAQPVLVCPMNAQPIDISKATVLLLDSGKLKVWYALNAVDLANTETYDDLQCLEVGEHTSRYHSIFAYYRDSVITAWSAKPVPEVPIEQPKAARGKYFGWSEYKYSEYVKDFSTNTFTEYARMPSPMELKFKYSENIPQQSWKILEDTSTVVGHLCQKATCSFSGREFTAWFSTEIPISNGPWKFGGLPGLVLRVFDKDKLYVFECVKIEPCKSAYPIKVYDHEKYEKTKRKKLLMLEKDLHENFRLRAQNYGWIINPATNEPKPTIPYQALELE
jgi:GLPGLI family protein